jgi:hypothetical protein
MNTTTIPTSFIPPTQMPNISLIFSNEAADNISLDDFILSIQNNKLIVSAKSNPAFVLCGTYMNQAIGKKCFILFGAVDMFCLRSLKNSMEKIAKKLNLQCALSVYYTEYHTDASSLHPSKVFNLKKHYANKK